MKKIFTILVVSMTLIFTGCFDDSDNPGGKMQETGRKNTGGGSVRVEEVTPVRITEPSPPIIEPRTTISSRTCPVCRGYGYTGSTLQSTRETCDYCNGTGRIEVEVEY